MIIRKIYIKSLKRFKICYEVRKFLGLLSQVLEIVEKFLKEISVERKNRQ
jgi:hypothetical protein